MGRANTLAYQKKEASLRAMLTETRVDAFIGGAFMIEAEMLSLTLDS
jgi:hypothetical protein